MGLKRVKGSFSVRLPSGRRLVFQAGKVVDEDHPVLVPAHRKFLEDIRTDYRVDAGLLREMGLVTPPAPVVPSPPNPVVETTDATPGEGSPAVEAASAAPGEVRETRRHRGSTSGSSGA